MKRGKGQRSRAVASKKDHGVKEMDPEKKMYFDHESEEEEEEERDEGEEDEEEEDEETMRARNLLVNAYILFLSKKRPRVRSENPDWTYVQVARSIGERWKNLPAQKIAKWVELSEMNSRRYSMELSNFRAECGVAESPDSN